MWEHCEEMGKKGEAYKQKYCKDFQVRPFSVAPKAQPQSPTLPRSVMG